MKNEKFKYKLLTTIRYLGDGLFYPFFALYLQSRGFSESRIGFLLAISPFMAIIMNPIYTKIANTITKKKLILGLISIFEGAMILGISLASNFYLIAGLVILMTMCGSCHYALMDSLVAEFSDTNQISYSSIRMFGSAAYIAATTIGGYLVENINFQLSFACCFILFTVSGIMYFVIKPFTGKENVEKSKNTLSDYKHLLKNKTYVLYVIFYALSMGLIYTHNNFLPTYLATRGVSTSSYGIYYSIFVSMELLVLILLNSIKKKPNSYLLLSIASICLAVRLLACYLDLPIPLVVAFTTLRGVGFAIMLHISAQHIIHVVGEKYSTLGYMLCELVYSVVLCIFNNVNGVIIENVSYHLFYLLGVIGALITLVLVFIMKKFDKKQSQMIEN